MQSAPDVDPEPLSGFEGSTFPVSFASVDDETVGASVAPVGLEVVPPETSVGDSLVWATPESSPQAHVRKASETRTRLMDVSFMFDPLASVWIVSKLDRLANLEINVFCIM